MAAAAQRLIKITKIGAQSLAWAHVPQFEKTLSTCDSRSGQPIRYDDYLKDTQSKLVRFQPSAFSVALLAE
jgi:hypothetical protein